MKPAVYRAVPVWIAASPQGLSRRHGSTGVARDGGAVFVGGRRRFVSTLAKVPGIAQVSRDQVAYEGQVGRIFGQQYQMDL